MYRIWFEDKKGKRSGANCGRHCEAINSGHFASQPGDEIMTPEKFDEYIAATSEKIQTVRDAKGGILWGNAEEAAKVRSIMDINGFGIETLLSFIGFQMAFHVSDRLGNQVVKLINGSMQTPDKVNKYDKVLGIVMQRVHQDINKPDDNPESMASYGAWLHLVASSMRKLAEMKEAKRFHVVVAQEDPDEARRLEIFESFLEDKK